MVNGCSGNIILIIIIIRSAWNARMRGSTLEPCYGSRDMHVAIKFVVVNEMESNVRTLKLWKALTLFFA